jgi:hypothetical protein
MRELEDVATRGGKSAKAFCYQSFKPVVPKKEHPGFEDFDYAFKGSSRKLKQQAQDRFKDRKFAKAFSMAIDPCYWRHGITINQGHGWNVSEKHTNQRLNYIRVELLRAIFGNNFRGKGNIRFLAFIQGAAPNGNQHFHVLMAIEGKHDWSDKKIAEYIEKIDMDRKRQSWEKEVYADWDWKKGNNFHRYVAREVASKPGSWYVF